MAVQDVEDSNAVRPVYGRVRLVLAAVWLLMTVLVVAGHERPSRLADLYDAVAGARVESVQVVGGLPAGATGTAWQRVTWRESAGWPWRAHRAELVVTSPGSSAGASDGRETTSDDVAARLRGLDPSLALTTRSGPYPETGVHWSWQVGSWEITGPAGALAAVTFLGSLIVLISGPEPWRATRWAWFWLCNPLTVIAFLLLSGPTPGVPGPRSSRRLTGGWSFLLALLLGAPFSVFG